MHNWPVGQWLKNNLKTKKVARLDPICFRQRFNYQLLLLESRIPFIHRLSIAICSYWIDVYYISLGFRIKCVSIDIDHSRFCWWQCWIIFDGLTSTNDIVFRMFSQFLDDSCCCVSRFFLSSFILCLLWQLRGGTMSNRTYHSCGWSPGSQNFTRH